MNTLLQKLLYKYHISAKDEYEITQIFSLLPPDKKQNILNNFDLLAIRLNKIEENIRIERQILVGDEVENIRKLIIEGRESKLILSK